MEIQANRYQYSGDVDVLDVAERHGCPVYVYDFEIVKRQYERLTSAFMGVPLKINYACKSMTNVTMLRLMRQLGAGLDAVSIQEVRLGLHAGFLPDEILYTPNCVSVEEMSQAIELGVKVNVDNISMLEQFGQQWPNYPLCVRINPHIMAGGNSKISTGHIDSKFGISFHQLPLVERIVKATGLVVEGLHMHTGSEILDSQVFLNGAEILLNAAKSFPDINYIDFGSGFKVPYKDQDIETDIEDLGLKITERIQQFSKEMGREITLKFEPGKYLVSEAGTFLTRVNVIKQTTSTVFAGVDSGLNHLIRPMFYDSYHHIVNVSRPAGKSRIYTVVGYICETDTFGVNRRISEIQEGDILAFKNAGAYCYSMSSNYNSRFRPAEVLIYEGKDYLIRRQETMEDLLRNQVEVDLIKQKVAV
ncbi:MAG: diaminopimelate decarboxylase [Bacteroidota bacterium]